MRFAYAHEYPICTKTSEVDQIELERGENFMFKRVLIRQLAQHPSIGKPHSKLVSRFWEKFVKLM